METDADGLKNSRVAALDGLHAGFDHAPGYLLRIGCRRRKSPPETFPGGRGLLNFLGVFFAGSFK